MTRTDAILEGIRRAVDARRLELDRADDLRMIEIRVFFAPQHVEPREIVVRPEHRHNLKMKRD